MGGVTKSTPNTSITFVEPNGVYNYTIGAPSGYSVTGATPGSPLVVAGANLTVNVTFAKGCGPQPTAQTLTFVESGLSRGTSWCVTVNETVCSSGGSITFTNLSPGSYSFAVGSVNGYTARPSSGTVSIANRDVTVTISFSSTRSHGCGG